MIAITLPWPSPKLSPNARCHWAVKSPITKAARALACYSTKAAQARVEHDGPVALRVTFHAPDKRHRDTDNMLASCKPMLDGIADALGVNDARFELTLVRGAPVRGGAVVVTL